MRIRLHPFGSHRLRAVPAGARRRRRRARSTPTSWSAASRAASPAAPSPRWLEVMRAVVHRSRCAAPIRRPLHAEHRPRRRTRIRRTSPTAVAARSRHRARTDRVLDRRIPDGARPTRESCGAATHCWTGPTAGGFRYAENMSVGSSVVAPVAAAIGTAATRRLGLGTRYFASCRAAWSSGCCPSRAPGPAKRPRERPLPGGDLHDHDVRAPATVATMAQRGDPGYKATVGAAGRVRAGAGARPRRALRPARRADPGRRDGRRAARALPGRGRDAGDRAADIAESICSASKNPCRQDQLG